MFKKRIFSEFNRKNYKKRVYAMLNMLSKEQHIICSHLAYYDNEQSNSNIYMKKIREIGKSQVYDENQS